MRILVLTKRQYTGKDLLDDRYGRMFELPTGLAARGHDVVGLAWSYRRRGASFRVDGGVRWWSEDMWPSPLAYRRRLEDIVAVVRPEVIWDSSDALHAIIAARSGRKWRLPVVTDLYDDYESFGLTAFPGLRRAFRQACARVDALSVVSHSLAAMLPSRMEGVPPVKIIGNGVPEAFGQRLVRRVAREWLGLPQDIRLIGTAGALDSSRGIDDLFRAYNRLREYRSDVRLVVAGPRDRKAGRALGDGVIDLGVLPNSRIPWLYSALDVGVVCNRDSAFGRACHPQKLVEMLASELPVVAAAVGDVAVLLGPYPATLYRPGDSEELAQRLLGQLDSPVKVPASLASSWSALAGDLDELLQRAIASHRR
ncbi:glycosyltransferase family 4 protein [Frateuria defendens]|uniref:glycosyltransferase family 4 protein n=1 Tax=Frateuria defendens TaxID=2219559 RepID=UPI0009E1FB44|nr:glycosyltransferase family 4 protein [Frateuria defendens]